jgi:heterodisulfide reductase subunit D
LKKTNIDFTLIDEHCCCSPILRTGQVNSVKDFINYNITQISNTGAKKIIASCAGCYRTLKKDWVKYGTDYDLEIYHTTELIKDLLDKGKLKFTSEYNKTLTYHDPCHLGRHMNLYDVPREVYKKIPGITFKEMKRNRENAWCCGAGGGIKIGYPEWSVEISKERLEEAKSTGASVISSICPFCRTNLNDANQKFDMNFEVTDLIEILDNLDFEISSN